MPYVESFDGIKIHYEIKGNGIPLILLPSCGTTTDYWKFQEQLTEKYQLVAIDIAGIGKSGKGRIEYSFPTFALDIKAVIDKERLDDCIILGHGMGGNVALETAALLKDEIRGLIIVDSLLPNTLYYGKKATEEEIAEVALEYQGNYKEYYDKLMRSMLGGRVESKTEDWIIDIAGYDANDPDILRAHVLIMLPYDYHDILDQVTCPIQYILRGAYRNSKQVLKEQQNAIFIDDVGHLSNIEKPELFNKLIDSIVQELIQTQ